MRNIIWNIYIVIIVINLPINCHSQNKKHTVPLQGNLSISMEEYKIYTYLIDQSIDSIFTLVPFDSTLKNQMYISAVPITKNYFEYMRDSMVFMLFDEYKALNQNSYAIDPAFINPSVIKIIKEKELDTLRFSSYAKIELSRVAIKENYSLGYMAIYYNQMDGEGVLFLLKKENSVWKIIDKNRLWVR